MMRTPVKHIVIVVVLMVAIAGLGKEAFAQQRTLTDLARQSIVYIWFDVADPTTGAMARVNGTGFIVSRTGYVLTASHLFQSWDMQTDANKKKNLIRGTLQDRPGFTPSNPLILQRIPVAGLSDASGDVSLLKLPYSRQDYPAATICRREASAARDGDAFEAFGFPLSQSLQGIDGKLGTTNAPDGRWAAQAPFIFGLSGAPVYSKRGYVIGLVEGGLEDAANWITPIQHVLTLLHIANYVDCPDVTKALVEAADFVVFENLFATFLEPVDWSNAGIVFDLDRALTARYRPLAQKVWNPQKNDSELEKLNQAERNEYDLRSSELTFVSTKVAGLLKNRPVDVSLDLHSMNIWNVDLRDADLTGANLNDTEVSESDMRGARLNGSSLDRAMLHQNDIERADLCGITQYQDSNFIETPWWQASHVDGDLLAYLANHFAFDQRTSYPRHTSRQDFQAGLTRLRQSSPERGSTTEQGVARGPRDCN